MSKQNIDIINLTSPYIPNITKESKMLFIEFYGGGIEMEDFSDLIDKVETIQIHIMIYSIVNEKSRNSLNSFLNNLPNNIKYIDFVFLGLRRRIENQKRFNIILSSLPFSIEKIYTNHIKGMKIKVPFGCEIIYTGNEYSDSDYEVFKSIEHNNDLNLRRAFINEYDYFTSCLIPIN